MQWNALRRVSRQSIHNSESAHANRNVTFLTAYCCRLAVVNMMHVWHCHGAYLPAAAPIRSAALATCPASHPSAKLASESGKQDSCVCAASRQPVCYAANRSEAAQDVAAESQRCQDQTAAPAIGDASVDVREAVSPAGATHQEQQSGQSTAPLWHVPWDEWWVVLIAAATYVNGMPNIWRNTCTEMHKMQSSWRQCAGTQLG